MKNCMQIELLIKLKKRKNQEVIVYFIHSIQSSFSLIHFHYKFFFVKIVLTGIIYYFIILTSKCIHLENIRKRHAFFSQVINVT